MEDIDILASGPLYFFYRPKVEHEEAHKIQDVQRFFIVLKIQESKKYVLLIIGRKHLPEDEIYYAYVDMVTGDAQDILKTLEAQAYTTRTQGERHVAAARCVGEGKFLLLNHGDHTHLVYFLNAPYRTGAPQEDFHIKEKDDFIINIKNPEKSTWSPAGQQPKNRVSYPQELQAHFKDRRFIPLNPPELLMYEGAELLIVGHEKADLADREEGIKKCLEKIKSDALHEKFEKVAGEESFVPIEKREWI